MIEIPDETLNGKLASQWLTEAPQRVTHQVFAWAERAPDSLALADAQSHWTYRTLADVVQRLARRFIELGVTDGARIAIVGENTCEVVASFLAASHIGAVCSILSARYAGAEIDRLLGHFAPQLCLFASSGSTAAARLARRWSASSLLPAREGGLRYVNGCEQAAPRSAPVPGALVVYTSGTTGDPKGVVLAPGSLVYVAALGGAARELSCSDRALCIMPVAHVSGLAGNVLPVLYHGGGVFLARRFSPRAALDTIAADGITTLHIAPTMYAALVDYVQRRASGDDLRALRYASTAAGVLNRSLRDEAARVLGVRLGSVYGCSEGILLRQPRMLRSGELEPLGRPLPFTQIKVLAADGSELGPGAAGRLHVRGPGVMQGYYGNREATVAALSADGWLDTGDIACTRADGSFEIRGRAKDVILRGGLTIFPADVERVLDAHEEVVQSAVVGRREPSGDETIVAYVQRAPGSTLTARALRHFAAPRLFAARHPGKIVFVDELPRTAAGKVARAQLQVRAQRGTTLRGGR